MRWVLLLLVACGDNRRVIVDVGVDAPSSADAMLDAAPSCCDLLPDQDAARACAAKGVPPGTCGVLACEQPDGSFLRLNFCGEPAVDAGQ